MIKKILLIICLYSSSSVIAQEPQEIVDAFFKTYSINDPLKALEDLYRHSPWLKEKNEGVENLKIKFTTIQEHVGTFEGYELLSSKNIKNTFVMMTYLIKFNGMPLTFTFQFYKPNKEWIVYSFSYDDGFAADMEKALKEELFKAKSDIK